MGKIVKFCASCEESFAEKFSFCPNCASELSPFEMKAVAKESPMQEEFVDETPTVDLSNTKNKYETQNLSAEPAIVAESEPIKEIEEQVVFEPVKFSDENEVKLEDSAALVSDDVLEIEVEEPLVEEEVFVAEDIPTSSNESEETMAPMLSVDEVQETYSNDNNKLDDGYHITVVSEKGGSVRNGLLLTAFTLVIFGFASAMVYSLFSNLDDVSSLGENDQLLALLDNNPMQTEEKEVEKKDDKDGGGGGGGGSENPKPATRGQLPSQSRIAQPPPVRVLAKMKKDPSLAVRNVTVGDIKRNRTEDIGVPDGAISKDMSGGPGSGGGFGKGKGTGFGGGFGGGEGNGDGTGSGNGKGNGNGDGTGDGNGRQRKVKTKPPPPPKVKPKGPTVGIKILSKPRPGYTDAARQNNVQGAVRLRVTFLKSGRVGPVSVIKGLSHGLNQKAIAAAKRINFKPPMRSGVAYSVSKVVTFNFNIY